MTKSTEGIYTASCENEPIDVHSCHPSTTLILYLLTSDVRNLIKGDQKVKLQKPLYCAHIRLLFNMLAGL
jgi:hypothetical protein